MPLIHPALLRPAAVPARAQAASAMRTRQAFRHEAAPPTAAPREPEPWQAAPPELEPWAAAPGGAAPSAAAALGAAPLVPDRFLVDEPRALGLTDLRELVALLAGADLAWRPLVRHDPHNRWYTRLLLSGAVEVWLIGWYPGQQTDIHDHGGALGALAVAEGLVEEDECGPDWRITRTHRHGAGTLTAFRPDHVHRIVNRGHGPATTIHAYSPPELPLRYAPAPDRRAEPDPTSRAAAAPAPREAASRAAASQEPAAGRSVADGVPV